MMVEGPSSLSWHDIVGVISLLGFRVTKVDGGYAHMRRGGIHVIVKPGFDAMEIHFHEDRGRSPHRLVVERSKKLLGFKHRLEAALEKQVRIKETLKRQEEKAVLESIDSRQCCPFHRDCPSFKEGLYIMTYCYSDYNYCDEYRRRNKLRRQGLTGKIDKTG